MVGDHVRHLVQDGCDLRVVGKRKKPAGDIEVAARQRERIHRRCIEDGDAVRLVRTIRGGNDPAHDRDDRLLDLWIAIDATVGGNDPAMLLAVDPLDPGIRALKVGAEYRSSGAARATRRRAAGNKHGE